MSAYFTIGYTGEASESCDMLLRSMQGYFVQVTTAEEHVFDAIIIRPGDWDGENGQPLVIRRCDPDGVFTGPEEQVDAVSIVVY